MWMNKTYFLYCLKYYLRIHRHTGKFKATLAAGCAVLNHGSHFQAKVIIGLAFDCVDKVVYWTDISEPSIGRASLHGGEPTTIIRQGEQANSVPSGAASSGPHSLGRRWRMERKLLGLQGVGPLPPLSTLFSPSEVCHRFLESLSQGHPGWG